jgi:hypothetical protein
LREWEWCKAVTINDTGAWVPWPADDRVELPLFQLKANDAAQEIEFMLNDVTDGMFQFRREPSIRRPFEKLIRRTPQGLPYLAPEVQLLYKAKHHRAKDESDFRAAIEVMSNEQRLWLRNSLQVWDSKDRWIAQL